METATTLEAASCSQRQVEAAAGPGDAEGTQVSHLQDAARPSRQLLPSIEGEGEDAEKRGRGGEARPSHCLGYTLGVHPPLCAGFKNFRELLLRVM